MLVQAAGGLVLNENREVLFMFRRGKWDLPKGKLDPGESLEDCALREVEEETGLGHLALEKFLLVTEHDYEEGGALIHKETHWYLMHANGNQPLIPQTEEDISDLQWLGATEFRIVESNTYPTIIDVLKAGGFKVKAIP